MVLRIREQDRTIRSASPGLTLQGPSCGRARLSASMGPKYLAVKSICMSTKLFTAAAALDTAIHHRYIPYGKVSSRGQAKPWQTSSLRDVAIKKGKSERLSITATKHPRFNPSRSSLDLTRQGWRSTLGLTRQGRL